MDPEQDQPNYFPTQGVQQLQQEPGNPRPYLPAPGPSLNQQAQQHPLTQMLDAMLPFGMADQLDLQRHLAGLTQIQQDHAADHLSDADAQSAVGTIMPRLSQLLQKQQKAQAQKMQQGVQQAMQGAALEEGVNAIHKKSRAENFGKEIASLVDPVSGHRAYFTQDAKGDWSEVKFDHAHAEDDFLQASTQGEGGAEEGGSAAPIGAADPGIQPASFEQPAQQLQEMKQQAAASGQPLNYQQIGQAMRGPSPDPATFEQTIQSGQHTDRYVGGKLASTTRQPASGGDTAVSEEQLKGMHEMARRAVGPLRHDAGPHERIAYDTQVHALVQSMLSRQQIAHEYRLRSRERQDQLKLQRQLDSEEHQRQEGARTREAERKEKQRLEDQAVDKQRHSEERATREYTTALEGIQKRHAAWSKDPLNEGKELPADLKPENHDYHATQAARRAIERGRELSGSNATGRSPAGGGGGDKGPPSAQAGGAGGDIKKIITTAAVPTAGKPADLEQVRRLLPVAQNALRDAKGVKWTGQPMNSLQAIHDLLNKAHQGGHGLNKDEVEQYHRHWRELDTTLKNHKVAGGAEWLKLDAKPPVEPAQAKAAAETAAPDRGQIRKANQEHVRWLEWAARGAPTAEARDKIGRAAASVKRAMQYEQMDKLRDLPAYEEGLKLAEAAHDRTLAQFARIKERPAFYDKSRYQKYQGE